MSLPYRISDRVVFTVVITDGNGSQPLVPEGDRFERAMDLLLRADPDNGLDVEEVSEGTIYVGNADRQEFPLRPDQSLNIRVTRRNDIFVKGGPGGDVRGLKLHMVAALLDVGGT